MADNFFFLLQSSLRLDEIGLDIGSMCEEKSEMETLMPPFMNQ